jgi:uncharacterized GH25 family protein
MFNKTIFLCLIVLGLSCPALAHDFWAGVEKATAGEPAVVFQGFGHHFPAPDEIKADVYAERFEPVTLIGVSGPIALKAGEQAWSFSTEGPISAGSYYVLASSKIGFASRTTSGYVRKSKTDEPTAVSCSYGANYGKNLINLDPAGDEAFVTKPIGQKL